MQGVALRSELRTNIPGHTAVCGEVTYASGVPSVVKGTRFTVSRGVLSLTVAASPTIVGAPNGTYTNVPVTTASGTTALCSLTVAGGAGVISAATVTAPGYSYTAAATMNVAVGSLFWTGGALAATAATAGTYYIPILSSGGSGMIAKVVIAGGNITSVTVNPAVDAATAVGSNYGTAVITYTVPAGALYTNSPAISNAFTLTPNPIITVGTITTVITGNCSVVFAGKVKSVIAALATPVATTGSTAFFMTKRYSDSIYVNFGTLTNVVAGPTASLTFATATPANGDGFGFEIVTTDTEVTT